MKVMEKLVLAALLSLMVVTSCYSQEGDSTLVRDKYTSIIVNDNGYYLLSRDYKKGIGDLDLYLGYTEEVYCNMVMSMYHWVKNTYRGDFIVIEQWGDKITLYKASDNVVFLYSGTPTIEKNFNRLKVSVLRKAYKRMGCERKRMLVK